MNLFHFKSPFFPFKEKCPTLPVTLFSPDERHHTDRSTFYTETTKTTQTQAMSGQGKLSAKDPPSIFSRRLFLFLLS